MRTIPHLALRRIGLVIIPSRADLEERRDLVQRRAPIARQHHIPLGHAAQRAVRPERFGVEGVDAFPAERLLQMLGEGPVPLVQSAFAVDVGDPRRLPEPFCHTANDPEGAIDVEHIELPRSKDRAQLRVELVLEGV